jgi:hypothetical protein
MKRAAASASAVRKTDPVRRRGVRGATCWAETELEVPEARCLATRDGQRSTNASFDSRECPRVRELLRSRFSDSQISRQSPEARTCEVRAKGPETRACEERALGRDNEPEESIGNDSDGETGSRDSDKIGETGAQVEAR